MLGELVRILSGAPYEEYVTDNLLIPLGLQKDVFADPAHRMRARGVTLAGKRSYLVNGGHPYHLKPPQQAVAQGDCGPGPKGWVWDGFDCTLLWSCDCEGIDCGSLYAKSSDCESDHVDPKFGAQPLPRSPYGDDSTFWANNVGPLDDAAPEWAGWVRYSGGSYMGGAPLAAGGWHADGVSMGVLIRALSQTDALMASSTSSWLWSPQWWNRKGSPATNWSYGLGWYIRGNWVGWAGGSEGSMATVLHNRAHDFTVVYLTNVLGNGLSDFTDPLLKPVADGWNTSPAGAAFPCMNDPQTQANECNSTITARY